MKTPKTSRTAKSSKTTKPLKTTKSLKPLLSKAQSALITYYRTRVPDQSGGSRIKLSELELKKTNTVVLEPLISDKTIHRYLGKRVILKINCKKETDWISDDEMDNRFIILVNISKDALSESREILASIGDHYYIMDSPDLIEETTSYLLKVPVLRFTRRRLQKLK